MKHMLLIDNTSKLKNIMEFKQGSYYKFVALIRAKDYKDSDNQVLTSIRKQEILVRDWMIDSQEKLNKLLPDMLKYTEMFKCRLYMCTDRKNTVKTLVQMRNIIDNYLDPFLGNPNATCSVRSLRKVCSSASNLAESSDRKYRYWLFDVDTKNQYVLKFIQEKICGEYYVETFETKAGYHILARRKFSVNIPDEYESEFNYLQDKFPQTSPLVLTEYISKVDVKENAMVLVAMGE